MVVWTRKVNDPCSINMVSAVMCHLVTIIGLLARWINVSLSSQNCTFYPIMSPITTKDCVCGCSYHGSQHSLPTEGKVLISLLHLILDSSKLTPSLRNTCFVRMAFTAKLVFHVFLWPLGVWYSLMFYFSYWKISTKTQKIHKKSTKNPQKSTKHPRKSTNKSTNKSTKKYTKNLQKIYKTIHKISTKNPQKTLPKKYQTYKLISRHSVARYELVDLIFSNS